MGWLANYKSCKVGIRFHLIVYSPTKPVITVTGKPINFEEVEPNIWLAQTTERVGHFELNGKLNVNKQITEIEVIDIKDVHKLHDTFMDLPNVEKIHFHGPHHFTTLDHTFKNNVKMIETPGLHFTSVKSAIGAFENSGIKDFYPEHNDLFNILDMTEMFKDSAVEHIGDISSIQATKMAGMFQGTKSLEYIKGIDTTHATDSLINMFKDSTVKVPNTKQKTLLTQPGGYRFWTDNFEPLLLIKFTSKTPIPKTDIKITYKNIAAPFTVESGVIKSWDDVDWFYIENSSAITINIIKGNLSSLENTFKSNSTLNDFLVDPLIVQNVTNLNNTWENFQGHLDLKKYKFPLVTTATNTFKGIAAFDIYLPDLPRCTNITGMFSDTKNLEYIDNITVQHLCDTTDTFKNTLNLIAPSDEEIFNWKMKKAIDSLKPSISYPFVAVAAIKYQASRHTIIQKSAPMNFQYKNGNTWRRAHYSPAPYYNPITKKVQSLKMYNAKEFRFLYDTTDIDIKPHNDKDIYVQGNFKSFEFFNKVKDETKMLEKIILKTPKLSKAVLSFCPKLSHVEIESASLEDATLMFYRSGPLTSLNIPTQNLVNITGMYQKSTITDLSNFVFPKAKTAQNFALGAVNLIKGPSFPNPTFTNTNGMYSGAVKLKEIGLTNTQNVTEAWSMFQNTKKLLCLKTLDTRKMTHTSNMFTGSAIEFPTKAEQAKLVKSPGMNYINSHPCPIKEYTFSVPQQSKWWSLRSLIDQKVPKGITKIKVLNGYTQPGFHTGSLSGLDVTFINSGAIEAVQEAGPGLILESPIKIINTGYINGGGGHGGTGAIGSNGGPGGHGTGGRNGHPGATTPAISERSHQVEDWGSEEFDSDMHCKCNTAWCIAYGSDTWVHYHGRANLWPGHEWGPTGVFGPKIKANHNHGHGKCTHDADYYGIVALNGYRKVIDRHYKHAVPGGRGGAGGKGGPGGAGGKGGAGGTGGTGQYYKHSATSGAKGGKPSAGGAAPTSWSGYSGGRAPAAPVVDGRRGHAGATGAHGNRGATGGAGHYGDKGGAGGGWGQSGHDGEQTHNYVPGTRTKGKPGGPAIKGKRYIKSGSSGVSGSHVRGSVI